MDEHERRALVGKHVQRTRRNVARIKSQEKFAATLDMSEGSVANLERGAPTVGDQTFEAAETYLGWPLGAIRQYVDTGDASQIPGWPQDPDDHPRYPAGLRRTEWTLFDKLRPNHDENVVMDVITALRDDASEESESESAKRVS